MYNHTFKQFGLALLAIGSLFSCNKESEAQVSKSWQFVWKDEFNYKGLPDTSKWGFDTEGNAWSWGNNEDQHYTKNDLSNASVNGNELVITPLKKKAGNKNYTSARLISKKKDDFLYGKVEVRAKLPIGAGTWPAIWMLPSKDIYGRWPNGGEIDIMENVGFNPSEVSGTIHTKAYNHVKHTEKSDSYGITPNEFHVYSVEWEQEEIRFYVDHNLYFTYKNEHKTFAEWPFNEQFYILLNLAIGGDMGGEQGIDDDLFPHQFIVDYVRVYQKV